MCTCLKTRWDFHMNFIYYWWFCPSGEPCHPRCSPDPTPPILVLHFWGATIQSRFPTATSSLNLLNWDLKICPLFYHFSSYWLPWFSFSLLHGLGSTLHSQAATSQGWVHHVLSEYRIPFVVVLIWNGHSPFLCHRLHYQSFCIHTPPSFQK